MKALKNIFAALIIASISFTASFAGTTNGVHMAEVVVENSNDFDTQSFTVMVTIENDQVVEINMGDAGVVKSNTTNYDFNGGSLDQDSTTDVDVTTSNGTHISYQLTVIK